MHCKAMRAKNYPISGQFAQESFFGFSQLKAKEVTNISIISERIKKTREEKVWTQDELDKKIFDNETTIIVHN